MKKTVLDTSWDDDRFVRDFDDKGFPVGSAKNEFGKLWLNGQSCAILSGFAEGTDKGRKALDAVKKHLATDRGIKLSWPGYTGYEREKGGVTTYPARSKRKRRDFPPSKSVDDQAFSYYSRINPIAKNDSIDEYECEPYCYAQNILANERPYFVLGRNSWLSGTASWRYQASITYILGLRPRTCRISR